MLVSIRDERKRNTFTIFFVFNHSRRFVLSHFFFLCSLVREPPPPANENRILATMSTPNPLETIALFLRNSQSPDAAQRSEAEGHLKMVRARERERGIRFQQRGTTLVDQISYFFSPTLFQKQIKNHPRPSTARPPPLSSSRSPPTPTTSAPSSPQRSPRQLPSL